MARRYYSSRNSPGALQLGDLYEKLKSLYLWFREKDYFKEAGITKTEIPDSITHEAVLSLGFAAFPITKWPNYHITEGHIFDALEFLYDHVARPGVWTSLTSDTGFNYYDYDSYDRNAGQADFREHANIFLADYQSGYELTEDGLILAQGADGLQHILSAHIPASDETNVDSKVRSAIVKWRNRALSLDEKRSAIRDLADVFEWLKKARNLPTVLAKKDESAIFELANNFAIRHHEPTQKSNYDRAIWYSWIFHFYLATYHAAIRLLIKHENAAKNP
jgi:hypothetical protein